MLKKTTTGPRHPFVLLLQYGFLALLPVLAGQALRAQTGDRLYGYSQVVTPGIAARGDIDANGNTTGKKQETRYSYQIFLVTAAKTRVYPVELWIKGNPYSARPEAVQQTPVEQVDDNVPAYPQKKVLVPKTTQKVTRLVPAPHIGSKTSAKAKQLAGTNEVVLVYKQGGKTYHKTLKQLTPLPPASRQ